MNYNVSILVLTYNSQLKKLERTLISALKQSNLSTEIIICDDGSENNNFLECQKLFQKYNYGNYQLLSSMKNVGTVTNIWHVIGKAKGEYIYLISPGDYFYDDCCLSKMYKYAKEREADLVFGNAAVYTSYNSEVQLPIDNMNIPFNLRPFYYKNKNNRFAFFLLCGNYITGATILRTRNYCLKYFSKINGVCKYIEDSTSCAYSIADGVELCHFDDYIIWYELGTGVSTNGSSKWQMLLKSDWDNFYELMITDFRDNKLIADVITAKKMRKKDRIKYLLLNNQKLLLFYFVQSLIKRFAPKKTNTEKIDTMFIDQLYKCTVEE